MMHNEGAEGAARFCVRGCEIDTHGFLQGAHGVGKARWKCENVAAGCSESAATCTIGYFSFLWVLYEDVMGFNTARLSGTMATYEIYWDICFLYDFIYFQIIEQIKRKIYLEIFISKELILFHGN